MTEEAKVTQGQQSALEFNFFGITIPTQNRFLPLQDDSPGSLLPKPSCTPARQKNKKMRGPLPPAPHCDLPDRASENHSVTKQEEVGALEPETGTLEQPGLQAALRTAGSNSLLRVPLLHLLHTSEGWKEAPPRSSPTLPVSLSLHPPSYTALGLPEPAASRPGRLPCRTTRRSVADTGAQMSILDLASLSDIGVEEKSLIPVKAKVVGAVKGSQLDIRGALLLEVKGPGHTGTGPRSLQMFYVAANVSNIYLSLSCLQDLQVVGQDFPNPGYAPLQVAATTADPLPEELCCQESCRAPALPGAWPLPSLPNCPARPLKRTSLNWKPTSGPGTNPPHLTPVKGSSFPSSVAAPHCNCT